MAERSTKKSADDGAAAALEPFSPKVRQWFDRVFEGPTPAQIAGWPKIASGSNTLISAPTGSGKTLAAFLWGIDRLARRPDPDPELAKKDPNFQGLGTGTRLVYVSPLKALSYDVERNLRAPLRGIGSPISIGLRTGDTPQAQRQAMRRTPPDILITTPESLYLMITSQVREILTGVEAVIVDEIHAVAQTKRGAHLALTLERLAHLVTEEGGTDPQRIGLSATQRPLERVGQFLVGPNRACEVVDTGRRKDLDLEIVVPVEDMSDPGANPVEVPGLGTGNADGIGDLAEDDGEPGFDASGTDADGEPSFGGAETNGYAEPGPDFEAPNPRSIWPAIYPELHRLVSEHTSTIIFVNNRRAAERLAKRLNEIENEEPEQELPATEHAGHAGPPTPGDEGFTEIARAHHGSLAHEERTLVEELLKSGNLPCLVATSSLELGIDMGAVDLVIQVESPKSVTRGLQRVGRAGHSLGETSRGRIFPKFRADLLECAVVARRMRDGEIEETIIPRNPLDVLAQHIVSMVADAEWEIAELERVVTACEPFKELGTEQLHNVLDMLDGRYPSERFADLRPRIVWDRTAGTIRGRKGARQLAVTNAGTIPDRGLYGVHMPDGRRVGELDEEMVYEARVGQTFLLGATTWRIEDITRDRVVVTPAPGVPGAVPFWRGDSMGRPADLGRSIGAFAREAVGADPEELAKDYDLDRRAAVNLVAYLDEQQAATRVVPSDQTIVVERFRDEIGDWRLCVLSPYGGRVHAAWGLALTTRLREELELEADAIWSDDGIVIHLPDADEAPSADLVMLEPDEVEDLIVRELGGSALFGARFRENAARSLLLPRAYPGKRTPLWQQRLKSQSLLEVAKEFPRFPVILETYRECLRDVLDVPALAELLRDLHSRKVSLVEVETQTASPFAGSLLFNYVATYMYEGDTPNAERRAAALALDRDLLRELLGQDELRELIDPDALAEVEASLQSRTENGQARDRDALQQILRRLGDLTDEECAERVAEGKSAEQMLSKLESERRIAKVRIAGEERWIAAEDSALYRDSLGVPPPPGLPDAYLDEIPDAMSALVRRFAATHGPFTTARINGRYGVDATAALRELERSGVLVRGELMPGGTEREWCDSDVLRRLRRASLAALRHEVEAVDQVELARFLPAWQNVDAHRPAGAGVDRLREALVPLQGLTLTPEVWERDVLPRRLGAWSPTWLDQLTTSGELVWVGAGALGRTGRVALYFREDVRLAGPPPGNAKLESPAGKPHELIRERLREGPSFWGDLLIDLELSPEALHEALWDLVWAGEATNDAFAPLRARRLSSAQRQTRRGRRFAARRSAASQTVQGRWSLTENLFRGAPESGQRLRAQAELMLERYGIVTRETVLAEGIPGGFSSLYGELSNLEMLGTVRRGYFVEGLGGAQFALAGAIERLRGMPRADGEWKLLAATDPAQPYGAALPWPKRLDADGETQRGGRRASRTHGAHVLLRDGAPLLYVERGGKGLLRLEALEGDLFEEAIAELTRAVAERKLGKLTIERIDGEPVIGSGHEETMVAAGFSRQPRRLVTPA